jgi:geranyl-CoA carboxylase alpha subunit
MPSRPNTRRFDTLLVANRGEIAIRIFRSAHALGLRTVAVYSDADADLPHRLGADLAIRIGPPAATESYLAIDKLIDAARRTGAQAIHPGYGFLSESGAFSTACREAGLVFVGPSPEAINAMGNKATAKRIMQTCGVPCIPGYDGAEQTDAALSREAARLGWPVMVKAVAGGGGKGMRLVDSAAHLPEALRGARSEALKSFGDAALMLERAVTEARHIEVQVFGDAHGNVVYLGDRDCSLQRRHQKIIEEAPAPGLTADLRERMGAAAVKAAQAVSYEGAGTVEFLVRGDAEFFFLEMNTRLQVEHPVTEAVTGLDLVEWQLRVAAGERLPLEQSEIRLQGHAIEARVYAEDPASNFLPQSGMLSTWRPPEGAGVRVDHALCEGASVTAHYDPMIAKVIAMAPDRGLARRRLVAAIEHFAIGGVANNLAFLRECLRHPGFAEGRFDTSFLDRHASELAIDPVPDRKVIAIAAAVFLQRDVEKVDVIWRNWRSRPWRAQRLVLTCGEWRTQVSVSATPDGVTRVRDDEGTTDVRLLPGGPARRVQVDGVEQVVHWSWLEAALHVVRDERYFCFGEAREVTAKREAEGTSIVLSPMPGSIVDVRVRLGARVEAGQVIMTLEAMKMEHLILAPVTGNVGALGVATGQQVGLREMLVEIVGDGPR